MVIIHYTKRLWNPLSWVIRIFLPRSLLRVAMSSHCIVEIHGRFFEAHMLHGVRELDWEQATKGAVVVCSHQHDVPDEDAALAFADGCATRKVKYDFTGAIGLVVKPGRDWREDDKYFCYEFAAAVLHAGGRRIFANLNHITEIALMAIGNVLESSRQPSV